MNHSVISASGLLSIATTHGASQATPRFAGLRKLAAGVQAVFVDLNRRRARAALLELARSIEATQPSYAQDLREAASRTAKL